MDRLPRPLVACGLCLLLAAAGCKATRPEVPPGRPFTKDGQQREAISFSSDGHPPNAAASTGIMQDRLGDSNLAAGIGAGAKPNGTAFGAPPAAYGAPGTSGLSQPPNLNDPSMIRASNAPSQTPNMGMSPSGLPPIDQPPVGASAAPNMSPSPSPREVPNQVIQTPMDKPGTMGTPEQMPSPF